MREEVINLMSIIPDELKPDVYARIKSFISAMIYDLHIQIDDVAYNDSTRSTMDKIPMMTSMMKIAAREMNIPENMLWTERICTAQTDSHVDIPHELSTDSTAHDQ
jgi:hypothetical protein